MGRFYQPSRRVDTWSLAFLPRLAHNRSIGEQMANLAQALSVDERWKPASELHALREEPRFSPLKLSGLKRLFSKGIYRGTITEIYGCRSSGRTSLCLHV